ncbi:Fe-S cluster assembly sulfur transfer protein SufU [Caviibacter abscessus]|uniref:Fe-S cluster assembly sulfur transfer protein SufU n=1 Tax=Caviibacter abscessus TaxID=1766719 RepID=UPI00082AB56A|nr:SUF system NifU family Fe-S cluster assembly protein [Caviibacter abscessus]
MELEKVYQLTLLEYANRNDLKKDILNATDVERGHNPSCGDDLSVMANIQNGIIKDMSFIGNGCAISTASTAMLIEAIKGINIEKAKNILKIFFKMIKGDEITENEKDLLKDAVILEMTKDMPARIKCATLSWHSTQAILDKY